MAKPKDDYKTQKDIWYKKLKKSGFNDIEETEDRLKSWSMRFAISPIVETFNERKEYFQLADRFLLEYGFRTNFEKVIWEYHANGLSLREIEMILKKAKIKHKKKNKESIRVIIMRLALIMKHKYGVIRE